MKIVVIGSGVMGSGIAEQIANAGFKVHLLDIVGNESNRNILAHNALLRMKPIKPENVIPGNLEDDIEALRQADWIIEVIIEKLEIKKELYAKLEQYCNKDCIISSNTSTIPLSQLIKGRNDNFKQNFLITHFFNPPRYMPLLELIVSDFTTKEVIKTISNFIDIHLGKTIVKCNDTPGFIANRIGCYWLETSLSIAIEMEMSVEEVDSLMSKPIGIPNTAIFGLYDLIGIDVMKLISQSLISSLESNDDFIQMSKSHQLVDKMIADGFTGRKGKGGFYKVSKNESGEKIKEVVDLKTGKYSLSKNIPSVKQTLQELMNDNQYISKVLSKTLSYAANLVNQVSDNISDIDQAMKLGYNWQYGPFELIDIIGANSFKEKLLAQNIKTPPILEKLGSQKFYQENKYFTGNQYLEVLRPEGIIYLKNSSNKAPVCINNSAKILDIGNEVASIEFTSKMAMLDHDIFNLILEFFDKHTDKFKAVVIANDQPNFSVGGNLKFMLENCNNLELVEEYLRLGQKAMLAIKYSKIPVISALKGMALGGGSELLLHSSGVAAHIETNSGLVEAGVGLIPGWGGCKEMILRAKTKEELVEAFRNIITGKVSSSAYELQDILKIENFQIVMNVNRVLEVSKDLALKSDKKQEYNRDLIRVDWQKIISEFDGYDQVIASELAALFANNNANEEDLLKQEREIFIKLLSNKFTQDRITYMLQTGKRLKN